MAYTAGFSVNVGDPTKASDVTTLAANDDFLKAAVDAIMADSATPSSTLKAAVVLADGVTATTQSAGNNTTRVATTAFVKTAVDASSTDPAGSNTQIQYNNSGAFGASANLTFDGNDLFLADGRGLVIGHTTQLSPMGYPPELQVLGTGDADSQVCLGRWSNSDSGCQLSIVKSRGTSVGASPSGSTIVQDGDQLGLVSWQGDDSTTTDSRAASIDCFVDGTPGVNQMPGRLELMTNSGASGAGPVVRMKIGADGDVTVSDGDLVIGTSGHGIDFSANSHAGGMTSELLDSYEEGTWTAVFKYGGTGGTSYSTGNNVCGYTKIGNIVHFTCETEITNPSASNSSSTTVILTGLPFTSFASVNRCPSPNIRINLFNLANCAGINGYIGNNNTWCALYKQMNNGTWSGDVKSSEIYQSSGSVWINVTGWYYTD
jgi:hypothetical protein